MTRIAPPVYTHRVLYGDTDQMGVVYYANYLRFFEGARNEWIRALGLAYREIEARGIMLPVLEVGVRYQEPARYDDLLEVHLRVSHTRVKIRFDYVVRMVANPGEAARACCIGHTVHACVGREGRPTRAPPWLLEALAEASSLRRVLEAPPDAAADPEHVIDAAPESVPRPNPDAAPRATPPAPPANPGAAPANPEAAAGVRVDSGGKDRDGAAG